MESESDETSGNKQITERCHGNNNNNTTTTKEPPQKKKKKQRILDFLRAAPSRDVWLHRFGAATVTAPRAFLRRVATVRYDYARFSSSLRSRVRAPAFVRTVDWGALRGRCVRWARRPANAALLVWLAFAAGGVAFVFLLMVGALDSAVPDDSRRRRWTEVANQVLNALFTVMCVYQHPRLCHHVVLLLRWSWPRRRSDENSDENSDDDPAIAAAADELRAVYCKNAAGGGMRWERVHVAFVVLLFHLTCLAQYAYCALYWVFSSETRPDWPVNFCLAFGIAAPVAAALYMVYGPLGRKIVQLPEPPSSNTGTDDDDESATVVVVVEPTAAAEKNSSGRVAVARPEWAGGLLDLRDDATVAAASAACTCCVFGWNMERMGMGNMYVHIFTFALLCAAPVLVFAVAALHVHDATLMILVDATGAVLAVLGLAYGGYWRAQMRRRFGLPADRSMCGGRPAAADYVKWLFCAPCALAQEVRTGNLYDVEDGSLYHVAPALEGEEEGTAAVAKVKEEKPAMAPLEREGRVVPLTDGKVCDGDVCVIAVEPPAPVRIE